MGHRTHWLPVAVPSAVAALLACAAVLTASQAACADPGHYVLTPGGVQLVGGCLRGDDLPVAPPPADQRAPAPPAAPVGD